MTDEFSQKCQIEKNETTGRCIKAVEDIRAGETLILEKPIVILPQPGDKRCSNCFKYALQYCSKCKISPLCFECQQHNDFDCNTISSMSSDAVDFELLKKNPDCFGILKCLLLYENPETQQYFESLCSLQSHMDKRRNTTVWREHQENIIHPLIKSNICKSMKISERITEDFLQNICGALDVNVFEIRAPDKESMRALYLNASMADHQCTSNVNVAIDDQYRMNMYANRNVSKGEMLSYCYTNVLLGTAERRQFLLEGKYFYCTCPRCEDPTELGSHVSSLICAPCAANNREGYIVNNLAKKTWECLQCAHSVKTEQVDNILERVKEEVFHAQDDVRRYEILLAKLSTILHHNHYIMIDIKQNIANILRTIIMTSLQRPGRRVYERKVRLCQELVLVLHTILPGISRLKGIALYELANASAELYRLKFGEQELSQQELQDYLKKCEAMLKESLRMLLYEPQETPEGQLTKSIISEIQDLRNDIDMLNNPLEESASVTEIQ